MAWVWWLSGPVLVTVLAALWSWMRARPARLRTTSESMAEHSDYLDALVQTARSRDRGLRSPDARPDARPDAGAETGRTDDAAA